MKKIIILLLLFASAAWAVDSSFLIGKWDVWEYETSKPRKSEAVITDKAIIITNDKKMETATYRIKDETLCLRVENAEEQCYSLIVYGKNEFFLPELKLKFKRLK